MVIFKIVLLFRAVANVHLFISGTLSLHVYRMMLTLIMVFFADKKTTLPASMKEWKEEIISGNNELAEWVWENVEITNNPDDVLSAAELKDKYKIVYGARSISDRDFISITKALFNSKSLECRDRYQSRVDGVKKEKRNAFIGVKLIKNFLIIIYDG